MYSVILMTAMTAGAADTPQWFRHGCNGCNGGCHGCAGYACGGCRGYACGGCRGYACGGCCGGYDSGDYYGGSFGPWAGRYVWGGYYGALTPSGWGYPGLESFYGPGFGGGHSYGLRVTDDRALGDVWGANYHYSASVPFIFSQKAPPAKQPMEEPKPPTASGAEKGLARITIELPKNAKLYVDGSLLPSDEQVRNFYTPALTPGQTYFYDVRVEMMRDNKLVVDTKRVYVRANDSIQESFKGMGESPVATK